MVVYQEDEWVCIQCLEYDFGARARSYPDALYELKRVLAGHIAICVENDLEPFRNLPPAPERFVDMFNRSKITLPPEQLDFKIKTGGVEVLAPELRVAAAA